MIYNKLLFIFVFYQGNGERDYWSGVGEAALVGGLTSVAYGGTVGRALKTSGKYADVQAVKEEIEAIGKKRSNLYINYKLTDAQEDALQKSEVANYRVLERLLQRSSDKKRADLIKRSGLSHAFDESGTLRTDFLRSLGERVMDGQTDTPGANEAQGAKSAAVYTFNYTKCKFCIIEGTKNAILYVNLWVKAIKMKC